MSTQNIEKNITRIYIKQLPSEPLQIGPDEYRTEAIETALKIVSDIKSTIRPTSKRSFTTQQDKVKKDQTSRSAVNEKDPVIRQQAKEIISSIINTIHPTAKPSSPSEITYDSQELDEETSSGDSGAVGAGKLDIKLSDRMEYLARPKKGVLYQDGFECPDGAIPEKHLPTWKFLPLHNKLPADQFPYQINMAKVSENLIVPSPPKGDLDLSMCRPVQSYNSLLDPDLKSYFDKREIREHLEKTGQVTESGRVVCSLKKLNEYRQYLARVQARDLQLKLKKEYEEEKREKEEMLMKQAAQREEEREKQKKQKALREEIKNTVDVIKEEPMAAQMEKDKRIINRDLKLKAQFKEKALKRQERHEKLQAKRMRDKRNEEKRRKDIELEMAKKDVERIEELCRRKREEKLERRRKLEEFWDRKAVYQSKWLEEGFELERKWFHDRNERLQKRKYLDKLSRLQFEGDETLEDELKEEEEPPSSKETFLDETSTMDSVKSSESSTLEITVSVTTSKEITLEDILKSELETAASLKNLKSNPSREEAVTPISSSVVTLEQILKKGEGYWDTLSESSLDEHLSEETTNRASSEGTTILGTLVKETAHRTSSKETANRTSSKETGNRRNSSKETCRFKRKSRPVSLKRRK